MSVVNANGSNINFGSKNRLQSIFSTFDATTTGTWTTSRFTDGDTTYQLWSCTSSGNWTPNETCVVQILVVGGGGGGGRARGASRSA